MRIIFSIFPPPLSALVFAQPSQATRDSINKITQMDYEQMLKLMGLKRSDMRPGPSGNLHAPNAANASEKKFNQYTLPDPPRFRNGRRVKSHRMECAETRNSRVLEAFVTYSPVDYAF